ncbi:MAG: sulfotransferase [Geminicoccaceae bacterium]
MHDHPERLAFIMGLGRSGTTFLAKLIDSSPDVLYRHEPDAILPGDMPSLLSRDDLERHLPAARAYVLAMTRCRRLRATGHLPVFRKAYRSGLANLAFQPMVLSTKFARSLRLPLPDSMPDLVARDRDVVYLIKSVRSLGRARLFADAFPAMASIHILRHPCAVCASTQVGIDKGVMSSNVFLPSLFAQKEAADYPFSLEDMQNATFEEQIAFRWMLLNDKAAADMEGAPGYLQIRYEDLCTDLEHMSRVVFDHLGLALGEQTKRFIHDISRPVTSETSSGGYFKINRPVTSAVDKWKTQLEPNCVARIRDVVSHSPLGRAYFDERPAALAREQTGAA